MWIHADFEPVRQVAECFRGLRVEALVPILTPPEPTHARNASADTST